MKVVRQARLELSGGSTPDQLRPPLHSKHPCIGGALSAVRAHCARSAGALQLLGHLAVLETHTL